MSFFASMDRKRVLTGIVTMLIAFGTGHIMQAMVAPKATATLEEPADVAPVLRSRDGSKPLPVPPAATLTPISLQPGLDPARARKTSPRSVLLPDDAAFSPFGLPCAPQLELTAAQSAMIEARLLAPCHVGQVVTFDHAGLEIEARTDALGMITLALPAFDETATLSAAFADGSSVMRGVSVPDASDYARVALIWEGPQVFGMHALELGARYGDAGHVWAGAPKSPDRAARGSGGFLTRFTGRRVSAEIYSYPIHHAPGTGVVRLTVAADVTAQSCNQKVAARALQTSPVGGVSSRDVKVAMPDCDAIGQTLRLKNLFQDMRLATR